MDNNSLTVTDNRTGKVHHFPLVHGCVNAMDLRQIKADPEDFGVMSYDPAFKNTASCQSSITFIDGDRGILQYRGYWADSYDAIICYRQVTPLLPAK
jgi:citrate synthase